MHNALLTKKQSSETKKNLGAKNQNFRVKRDIFGPWGPRCVQCVQHKKVSHWFPDIRVPKNYDFNETKQPNMP